MPSAGKCTSPPKRELRRGNLSFPSLTIQQVLWSPGDGKKLGAFPNGELPSWDTDFSQYSTWLQDQSPPGSYPPPQRILTPGFSHTDLLSCPQICQVFSSLLSCLCTYSFFFPAVYPKPECFSSLKSHTKWHVLRDDKQNIKQNLRNTPKSIRNYYYWNYFLI